MKFIAPTKFLIAATVAVALLCAARATAGSDTSMFQVNANVISGCAINSIPDLSLGNYVQGGGVADGSTSISLTCSSGTAYVIALNYGLYTTGGTTRRLKLTTNTNYINYNLYTGSGHVNIWKDTSVCSTPGGSSVNCIYGTGTGTAQSVTIYGEIAAGQYPGPNGSFTDTITATINF